MKTRALILLVLTTSCVSVRVANPPRECSPMASWHDNPINSNGQRGGWDMPRLAWWLFFPALTGTLQVLGEKATPMSMKQSGTLAYVGTAIVPHAIGYAMKVYPVTPDMAFDAVDRSLPLLMAAAPTTTQRLIVGAAWVVSVAALHCYASP